jgi:penicillin amidase
MRALGLRFLKFVGLAVVLVIGAVAVLLWETLPSARQAAHIPGLSAPVDIHFDIDGVPHIRATTERDAIAALGFVHARDRMFEMDMGRRAAAGRISELAGPATLWIDRSMRTLGLARAAAADYAALPAGTKALLEDYAKGVNAWIDARGRFSSPEHLVIGAPERWQPADGLLRVKTMELFLSANWRAELARLALAGHAPQWQIDELWRSDPPRAHTERDPSLAPLATRLAAVFPRFPDPWTLPDSASNEWAVDGAHSATGAPILAGDPHLQFGFPSIWYLVRIDTPGLTLVGATAPGFPFLVIGHNGRIAWTFTTTDADVQDVFIESPNEPTTSREERIAVRGQPDEVLTVRETRHGPVVSDLAGDRTRILAVAMGNLQPNDTAAAGLLALSHAGSVAEAGAAAPLISSPVQNLLVADRTTIGQFVTGRIPIRKAGDGSVPVPGDGSHDWIGWASGDELPHTVAPANGRLVNANERIAPPDFPVFLGRDWYTDWRARRIHALLDSIPKPAPADFARMQTDVRSSFAAAILPVLRAVPDRNVLAGWGGDMSMDAPQPLMFNLWIREFHHLVRQRAGIATTAGGPEADFVDFVLSPAGAHWCGGDCTPLLREALDNVGRTHPDYTAKRWGTEHPAVFAHPMLSGIPLLGDLTTFSIPSPGDDTTVGRGSPDSAMHGIHGASYRGVYDLSDLDRSLFMLAPGQSGHPFRAHASDLLRRWRDGATIVLPREPQSVAETIELTP